MHPTTFPVPANLTSQCAECGVDWDIDMLLQGVANRTLRQQGFAYIAFPDTVMVNHCPQCELPNLLTKELQWPIPPPFH